MTDGIEDRDEMVCASPARFRTSRPPVCGHFVKDGWLLLPDHHFANDLEQRGLLRLILTYALDVREHVPTKTHASCEALRHVTKDRGWFRGRVGQLVERGFKHGAVVQTAPQSLVKLSIRLIIVSSQKQQLR